MHRKRKSIAFIQLILHLCFQYGQANGRESMSWRLFLLPSPDVNRIFHESLDFHFIFLIERNYFFSFSLNEWMRFEFGECDLHKCVNLKENCFFSESFIFLTRLDLCEKFMLRKRNENCLIMEKILFDENWRI